jgi:hypothetical protein
MAQKKNRFGWLMYCLIGLGAALLICAAVQMLPVPANHPIGKAPAANQAALDVVRAEQTYFAFLGTGTLGFVGVLFAWLNQDRRLNGCRKYVVCAIVSFLCAVGLLVAGYAERNMWQVLGVPFPNWLIRLDLYVSGPITALLYIVGVPSTIFALVRRFLGSEAQLGRQPQRVTA